MDELRFTPTDSCSDIDSELEFEILQCFTEPDPAELLAEVKRLTEENAKIKCINIKIRERLDQLERERHRLVNPDHIFCGGDKYQELVAEFKDMKEEAKRLNVAFVNDYYILK
jgi:hypothetical protein